MSYVYLFLLSLEHYEKNNRVISSGGGVYHY